MSTTRLETLDGDTCLGLLAEGGVGRIGIAPGPASGPYPLILPVDYRVDDAGASPDCCSHSASASATALHCPRG